jgi:hypothetical protein
MVEQNTKKAPCPACDGTTYAQCSGWSQTCPCCKGAGIRPWGDDWLKTGGYSIMSEPIDEKITFINHAIFAAPTIEIAEEKLAALKAIDKKYKLDKEVA